MTTHVFLQKFNLGVLVSTCFTLKMLFTTVWRLWILFIWSWILILIIILFLHVLQDRWNRLPERMQRCTGCICLIFSTVCFQMLSPIVCLHTYNHTCCIVTRWNGFSPECFLCDLSNRCRKSYICHTNYRRNVLNLSFISGQVQGGTRGYLKKMGFLHQNLLKELRRSRKAKLTPEEAGEGADPVVPESVEEEIDESALVDGMPGRGDERNQLVELQNLGFGQRSFTVVTLNYCSCWLWFTLVTFILYFIFILVYFHFLWHSGSRWCRQWAQEAFEEIHERNREAGPGGDFESTVDGGDEGGRHGSGR